MNKATSIHLDEDSEAFIGQQIAEGNFSDASEVVEAALRLLRDHDQDIEAIRAALIEGEESGEPQPFDFDRFLEMKRNAKRSNG